MIQQLLLAGQLLLVICIYLFVWRVMRTARRDIVSPTSGGTTHLADAAESTIIPASQVAHAKRAAGIRDPRLLVEQSASLRVGVPYTLTGTLTVGRSADNDIVLEDAVVSGHHCRIVAPDTVIDLDSTNGTLVNGARISGRRQLRSGDRIAVGATVFRYEGQP